jgi:hypothetical protein
MALTMITPTLTALLLFTAVASAAKAAKGGKDGTGPNGVTGSAIIDGEPAWSALL